jgi:hypothetical protein
MISREGKLLYNRQCIIKLAMKVLIFRRLIFWILLYGSKRQKKVDSKFQGKNVWAYPAHKLDRY